MRVEGRKGMGKVRRVLLGVGRGVPGLTFLCCCLLVSGSWVWLVIVVGDGYSG